jgi:molecular chaperone GrpE
MTTERENDAATPEDSATLPDDPASLKAQLDEEREKAQAYMQSWQRAAADYQNFKRRVEEERSETARFANASLIINLLPLLDDLERALQNVDIALSGLTWVDGIRLIHRKFQSVLEMAGVTEIEADGHPFDPAVHEAVAQVPGPEGKIVSVAQKGYRLGDRVIRPAMVVVGKGQAGQAEQREDS